jgi:hypothetical protein
MAIPLKFKLEPSTNSTESGYSCLAAVIGVSVQAVQDADDSNPEAGKGLAELALRRGVYMRYVRDIKVMDPGFVYLAGHRGADDKMQFVLIDKRGPAQSVYDPSGLNNHPLVKSGLDLRDFGDNILVIRCLEISEPSRACQD